MQLTNIAKRKYILPTGLLQRIRLIRLEMAAGKLPNYESNSKTYFFSNATTCPYRLRGPALPVSCTVGTVSFPVAESGLGVKLNPHPLLVPRSKKLSSTIPLLSLRAFVACEKVETYIRPALFAN
jgi:hypothetical protein